MELSAHLGALIGHRVTLRHVVGERDGRPLHSDAVGDLARDGDGWIVTTRTGPVRVVRERVTAVRAVPPAARRRASLAAVARLEGLCADAWPAFVDEPLGAWRLRAAGGFTGRANAALAIGSPGMPVPAALQAVRAFAAHHGVAPRVQAPIGSPWDRSVAAEGWVLDVEHLAGAQVSVQVAELAMLAPPSGTPAQAAPVVAAEPSSTWWRLTGGDPADPARRHVLTTAPDTAFLTLAQHGALRVTIVSDHAHLSLLTVDPTARRHGLGSGLVAAGAAWARAGGARWGVLQVGLDNAGARALYARLGFVEHHRYRYLVPPPP